MKTAHLHLNLLKDSERVSSSPIRLRVMLPLLALLSCVGMIVWWGTYFTQVLMAQSSIKAREIDIAAKSSSHAEVIRQMEEVRELTGQLEQLQIYRGGVRKLGASFAALADVMPLKIQLTEISMSAPPRLDLTSPNKKLPPGKKAPKVWGPTTNVETQKLAIVGRATRETPVQALINSLEDDTFTNIVTRTRKIRSDYRKASGATNNEKDATRYLAFELLYTMPGRRFAK